MQHRIPPELRQVAKAIVPITGIDKLPKMEHHDPSNVVHYGSRRGGRYSVWFSEHPSVKLGNDGFQDACIKLATSANGLHWGVQGVALTKGDPGYPGAKGVLTCYGVPSAGAWWMAHTAVGPTFSDPHTDRRGLWLAQADTPTGPWRKHQDRPILRPGDDGAWDELCCDDADLLYREGRWWLYYKGRLKGSHPMDSFTGLATASRTTGPDTKHPSNPLMTGHAASLWNHRRGAAAVGDQVDAPEDSCVRWSEHGIHFFEAGVFPAKSTGFCHERPATPYSQDTECPGVRWGFDVVRNTCPRFIYRFDCSMHVPNRDDRA